MGVPEEVCVSRIGVLVAARPVTLLLIPVRTFPVVQHGVAVWSARSKLAWNSTQALVECLQRRQLQQGVWLNRFIADTEQVAAQLCACLAGVQQRLGAVGMRWLCTSMCSVFGCSQRWLAAWVFCHLQDKAVADAVLHVHGTAVCL